MFIYHFVFNLQIPTTSISMVNLCQILRGIYVDHNIIKITKDNTVGLEDCFFLREINT